MMARKDDLAKENTTAIRSSDEMKDEPNENNEVFRRGSPVVAASSTDPVEPINAFDTLLAKELHCLTIQERDLVKQQMNHHGVNDTIFEEPFMVSHCFNQLEALLRSLPRSDTDAYWQAHAVNSAYTTDPEFRLKFLRAERFNVPEAADRMARFFRQKLILFGPDKLGKAKITLEDLSEDDMDVLECGYMQWLHARDSAGRAIYFTAFRLRRWKERSNMLRALWYLLNVGLEDEDTQKNGIVFLAYLMGFNASEGEEQNHRPPLDRLGAYYIALLFRAIPVRVEVFHSCCEHTSTNMALKLALFATGTELRVRTKTHCGTHIEIFYELLADGIPVKMIPVNEHDVFDLMPHRVWMEYRRQKELPPPTQQPKKDDAVQSFTQIESSHRLSVHGLKATGAATSQRRKKNKPSPSSKTTPSSSSPPPSPLVPSGVGATPSGVPGVAPPPPPTTTTTQNEVEPQPQDVLLGKLKLAKQQQGNDLLLSLIDEYRPDYERCCSKYEKVKISKRIVDKIKSKGGRFLKQTKLKYGKNRRVENNEDSIGWMEVSDSVAREKISHTFRNLRLRSPLLVHPSTTGTSSSVASLSSSSRFPSTKPSPASRPGMDGDGIGDASRLSCKVPPSMVQGPPDRHGCGGSWF